MPALRVKDDDWCVCVFNDDGGGNVQRENIHFNDGFVALKSDTSGKKTELELICVCCFKSSAAAPVSVHLVATASRFSLNSKAGSSDRAAAAVSV